MREEHRAGIHYLEAATALLRRVRSVHPTAGLLEAADLHWWWRTPRSTDHLRQLFWFDHLGRPEAAVIATDWGDAIALDPIVMPGAAPGWIAHVIGRGLAHAGESGFEAVDVVVDRADGVMREVLAAMASRSQKTGRTLPRQACPWSRRGWQHTPGPGSAPCAKTIGCSAAWTRGRVRITWLTEAGRTSRRAFARHRCTVPDSTFASSTAATAVAAYGLFWFDPDTATGLVEPMRTEAGHQRRGLARHVLAAGIDLLAQAGATRIKLCFSPGNPAARGLYLSAGFEPDKQTAVFSGRAGARTS